MKALLKKSDWTKSLIALLIAAGLAISAHAQTQGIAKIVSSKGNIVLENKSVWVKNPEPGKIIYHGDKILTMPDSSVQLQFDDGSVLDIFANSNVRITQPSRNGLVSEEELGKREIRTFIGKVRYKSGENKDVTTRMVSPTAVAALRGTIVEFGTDGNYTLLNRIEGNSTNTGNITEGYVPDIKPEQAAKDPMYQAVLEASKAWEKYQEAKKVNASDANVLLAKAVQKTNEALVLENKSLVNNPDTLVKTRAAEGLRSSQEALRKPLDALKSAIDFQQKIEQNGEKAQKNPEYRGAYQLIVDTASKVQDAIINTIKAYMSIAENHTAELHDTRLDQKIEQTVLKNIEIALDMAKAAERKVEALVQKAINSKDPNVASAALKSAEVFATSADVAIAALISAEVFSASAEANAALTGAAVKVVQAGIDGDKTELDKLNQSMTKILETAGNISDKAIQTEAIVERVEKAVQRGDTESVKDALLDMKDIQKEVNAEVKTLPVAPVSVQTTTQTTTTTTTTDTAKTLTTTTTDTTTSATDTGTQSTTTGISSDMSSGTSSGTLMQQPPPFQDVKTNTPPPYGQ